MMYQLSFLLACGNDEVVFRNLETLIFEFFFSQVIEEMGKDIRPTYSGSKNAAERLKRGIINARILVRDCLMETERSGRPQ